jgi:hypothetical protein
MTFAAHILRFLKQLKIDQQLPVGVEVLNPYQDKSVYALCELFYNKYYGDDKSRRLILGINPGRFGAGVTGIPFTDPIKLEKFCGIPNSLQKKPELSADFIYKMITAYGGAESFYSKFHFSAVSPLGFVKDGKNLNYYDIRELEASLRPFIIETLTKTLNFGIDASVCYCLGEGENFKFLSRLNEEKKFFKKIIPLAHPRFIMQYRRKRVGEYVDEYVERMKNALPSVAFRVGGRNDE